MFKTTPKETSMCGRQYLVALATAALIAPLSLTAYERASETTNDRLLNAHQDAENWLHHHRDYAATRHSPLDEINTENVADLRLAYTFHLGGAEGGGGWDYGGLTATPVVEDGFMYVATGWGEVYKLAVRDGKRAKLVWKMDPAVDRDWVGPVTCCGINNRGVTLWEDKVISHALDGRLIATDKQTGEIAWEREIADVDDAETITVAPLIVENMAITGMSGGEFGVRGWLEATDLETGEKAWRVYTIPAPGEPGHETWEDDHDAWKTGGGPTWVTGSYDPELELIYWGIGNPGPDWDVSYRPGDNLYTNSVLALDLDGNIKWHFQWTPNDPYDYDGVNENHLVDIEIDGVERKVLLHADRNGFAYALDRETGEFLYGKQFVDELTWTEGLDDEGLPLDYRPGESVQTYAHGTAPHPDNPVATVCPGNMGGKNWQPAAYNPDTQMWYIPVIESCNQLVNEPDDGREPREWFTGGFPRQHQPITGSITKIDARTGEVAGKYRTDYPQLGGLLSTAGGLVFGGEPAGRLDALDADTLEKLWSFETGGGLNAPPMTFAVDGKQYVAVLVGLGGAWARWFVDATEGLEEIERGSMLYVFAL